MSLPQVGRGHGSKTCLLRAPPTVFIFLPLAKISLPLAKIYRVAPVFVFFKRVNVLQCVLWQN